MAGVLNTSVAGLLSFCICCASAEECVGKANVSYLPPGFIKLGGWLIGPVPNFRYALSLACRPNDSRWTVFMHRDERTGNAKDPIWVSRAVLTISQPAPGYTFASEYALKGNKDPEIIAIVRETRGNTFTHIRRAWRANRALESFAEI